MEVPVLGRFHRLASRTPEQEHHTAALEHCTAATGRYMGTNMLVGRTSRAARSSARLAERRRVQQVEHTRSAGVQGPSSLYVFVLVINESHIL